MLKTEFYNASIRKYVTIFGGLFADIYINRKNTAGTDTQNFKVPIAYGPREKFLARIEADPGLNRGYSVFLPRIGFEIVKMVYASDRKNSSLQTYNGPNISGSGINALNRVYVPVPYDLHFRMAIMVKEAEDAAQIVEQILPFFTPEYTLSVHMLDQLPTYRIDIPIVLNNITLEDTYDEKFTERRTLIYSLDFTLKGYFFGPVTKSAVIKIATSNLYGNTYGYTTVSDFTYQVMPGLLANNYPTTNASLTLPYSQINESNNYGYIIKMADYSNNAILFS